MTCALKKLKFNQELTYKQNVNLSVSLGKEKEMEL